MTGRGTEEMQRFMHAEHARGHGRNDGNGSADGERRPDGRDGPDDEVAMWCHLLLVVPIIVAELLVFLPWTTALPFALLLAVPTALVA